MALENSDIANIWSRIESLAAVGRRAEMGLLAAELAEWLPLIREAEIDVWEQAELRSERRMPALHLFNARGRRETVATLRSAEAIARFAESRRRAFGNTPWDSAARLRLVRNLGGAASPHDELCLIEPGANHLVLWLESQRETETLYSCEGHPNGFYVTFRGPNRVAECLRAIPILEVEEVCSIDRSGLTDYIARLPAVFGDFEARDAALRDVAFWLEALDPVSQRAGQTAQGLMAA
ncbi:MAG TPA: hypothetical protein VEH84_18720 [Alphaproteobacteria bacterium]|nr:hypothetical protein [Alphaproteobacteria bacterium]